MRKLLIIAAASVAALPSGSALPAEQMHAIAMKGVAFAPATITAKVGDTLEWDNGDIVAHTATSKEGGFDVNVPPGRKGSTVVKAAGTFDYICRYHPNMKGQIIAEP
jgi:plastocyanin